MDPYAVSLPTPEESEAVASLKLRIAERWVSLPPPKPTQTDDTPSTDTDSPAPVEPESSIPYYPFTDTALLRFYRGRQGDLEKAYNALCRTTMWRHENNVDNITDAEVESELATGKVIISDQKDHRGRPLAIILARKHNKDLRDINIMKKFIIHTLENTLKHAIPTDEKVVIIFDLHDFGFSCMDYEVVKLLIEILQYNYPETLSWVAIINAPFIFSACWLVIKPWLDPVTQRKVIFPSNQGLADYVDVESLPSEVYLA